MRYRKKPVEIEAHVVTRDNAKYVSRWINLHGGSARLNRTVNRPEEGFGHVIHNIEIDTLEGTMTAQIGDYIIRGVQGEFYPCKPDIFDETYELVEETE